MTSGHSGRERFSGDRMDLDLEFLWTNLGEAVRGIPTTLAIIGVAMAIGIPLAFFIALARLNHIKVLSPILTLIISFLRGTPMMVQIFLVYNGMPLLLKAVTGPDFDVYSVPPILYAFLVFALPSFCSSTLTMLKNTSLVFVMTVMDITARAKVAAGLEYKYVEGYLDMFLVYLVVCSLIELAFKLIEKKMRRYQTDSAKNGKAGSGQAGKVKAAV